MKAGGAPPCGAACAALVADPHFRHQVELLCAKGPRLPAELLAEVAIEYGLEDAIRKKIARYLRIPDAALDVTGAREFPPLPLPPPHGDSAPLTLLDILPNRSPTATQHRGSMRRFGEIAAPIVQDLALRRLRDE